MKTNTHTKLFGALKTKCVLWVMSYLGLQKIKWARYMTKGKGNYPTTMTI